MLNSRKFQKLLVFGLGIILVSSCGPTFCDCVWGRTNNEEFCRESFKTNLGTEYPSTMRLESVRKGSCKN